MTTPVRTPPRVALATCAEYPQLDDDGKALVAALRCRDVDAVPVVWDDPGVEWGTFELVLPCWTWGYFDRRDAFLTWAAGLRRVANPVDVLRWNGDKTYLSDLAAAGVAVVETRFVAPGERLELPGTRFVVKPTLATGAVGAASFWPDEVAAARRHIDQLHATGRTAMIQPYLTGIDRHGEVDLVFIGTTYSHAVGKRPLLTRGRPPGEGFSLQEDIRTAGATTDERALADQALAVVPVAAASCSTPVSTSYPGPTGTRSSWRSSSSSRRCSSGSAIASPSAWASASPGLSVRGPVLG